MAAQILSELPLLRVLLVVFPAFAQGRFLSHFTFGVTRHLDSEAGDFVQVPVCVANGTLNLSDYMMVYID